MSIIDSKVIELGLTKNGVINTLEMIRDFHETMMHEGHHSLDNMDIYISSVETLGEVKRLPDEIKNASLARIFEVSSKKWGEEAIGYTKKPVNRESDYYWTNYSGGFELRFPKEWAKDTFYEARACLRAAPNIFKLDSK